MRFQINGVVMAGVRPRPPCGYIQKLTEPGMTKALARCGGICASVIEAGVIKVGDPVEVLLHEPEPVDS
jgi:MOSC domain-containing protein YiiM